MMERPVNRGIEVVLGDDHVVFVDALSAALTRDGFDVTAVAHTVVDTIEAAARHRPDVCVIDRGFADGDGIDAIGDILDASDRTRVVVLTADRDAGGAEAAIRAGASGYVNKMCDLDVVRAAIRAATEGEIVLDLAAARRGRRGSDQTDVHRLAAHLTGREWECLALLVAGAGTGKMARQLGVSATTVRTHVQSLLTKLGVHSRLEAAALAVHHSLLRDRPGLMSRSG